MILFDMKKLAGMSNSVCVCVQCVCACTGWCISQSRIIIASINPLTNSMKTVCTKYLLTNMKVYLYHFKCSKCVPFASRGACNLEGMISQARITISGCNN